jgi:hypothetical protein
LRISITIGTAAITRSLSTAAVVQAEFFIDKTKKNQQIKTTYLPIHAKIYKIQHD